MKHTPWTFSVSEGYVRFRLQNTESTNYCTAETERDTYALYTQNGNEGDRAYTERRENTNEEVQMTERDDGPESEDGDEIERDIWAGDGAENEVGEREGEQSVTETARVLSTEGYVSEVGEAEARTNTNIPMEMSQEKEEGGVSELEKRDEWPTWLKSGVDMLWAGSRGKEFESILIKLIMIERSLGFKGEKTVRANITTKEPHSPARTNRETEMTV